MNSLEYIVQAETIKMIAPKFKQRKIIFSSDGFVAVAVMNTRLKRANITENQRAGKSLLRTVGPAALLS